MLGILLRGLEQPFCPGGRGLCGFGQPRPKWPQSSRDFLSFQVLSPGRTENPAGLPSPGSEGKLSERECQPGTAFSLGIILNKSHFCTHPLLFLLFRCGRVGKHSWQGPVGTNNQGSVQRSAILQILNCLYNPHLSPHGCLNPSNGFFYGRSHLFRIQNYKITQTAVIASPRST